MDNFYNKTVRNTFIELLENAELGNKDEEVRFVAYSEFLVQVPNERTDSVVKEVLLDKLEKNGLESLTNDLKRILDNALVLEKESDLKSEIYNYYLRLIK